MKKIIFYLSLVISLILLVNIAKIIIMDYSRLTEYGMGYLVGKLILFLFFLAIAFFTRKQKSTRSQLSD